MLRTSKWERFGLNNIVGYLKYDEALFDEVKIEGVNDWHFEQNQNKNHERYGKFVVYTMKEGVTDNQNVAVLTLKLKSDLRPQTTEVTFTELKSSDGEVSVDEDDRKAIIEIYEVEQDPEIPEVPEKPQVPEQPAKTEKPREHSVFSVKTGDGIIFISAILVLATIALNVLVFLKNKQSNVKGIKLGIVSAISIISIGLLLLGITSFAHNSEITELIKKLDYKEYLLNSEKYLVTDENVSRIAPLTNIQEITDKFNKEIEVYNKNSNENVTEGLVKSGMRISDKEQTYDVSVLGDIDGDGESNHIELTNIIRNIMNPDKYKFDNLEKLSADMNIDKVIDQGDVNTSVRYILYGELDIPGFDQVKEPKIEVIGGTFNEKIDAYENTIQVKITEQDENATKTKYKIEGTEVKPYTEIESGGVIELPNNGVYKISAYSYGKLGNRSEIPYQILIKKNPNNKYKIITRTENEDGTYEEFVEEKEDRIGKIVTIDKQIPDGYKINEEKSKITGEIQEEEIIELIVTYDRKEYTLTLESGDYISSVKMGDESNTTISKKFKFGKTVDFSAEISNKDGYTTTFDRWSSSNKELISDSNQINNSIKMPKSDITLTAKASRVSDKDTKYKVKYFYEKDGFYGIKEDSSKQKNGETDTEVEVDEEDKTPTKSGYTLDESKTENWKGSVKGDNSLVLEVYFKQQFTVTYKSGNHGIFKYSKEGKEEEQSEEKHEKLRYNDNTPDLTGALTPQEGYEFNGWDKAVADKVTEDVEYVATWKEKGYEILYTLNGGTLGKDDKGNEITNPSTYTVSTETFTLKNPSKEGYIFKGWTGTDLNAESKTVTIQKGSTGDRAYVANWEVINYEITYELNGGDLGSDEQGSKITNPSTYNIETPDFILNNPHKIGYTFVGWTGTGIDNEENPEETIPATTVTIQKGSTGNRRYEAVWQVNTNVEYQVKYYKEKLESEDPSDKTNYMESEKETYFGTTDQNITLEVNENKYTGFTYNSEISTISGNVRGDGKLVLEVYYTRNLYTLELKGDDNVESVEGKSIEKNIGTSIDKDSGKAKFKYEQPIEINANLKTEDGYDITFVKWESKNTDLLEDKFDKNTNFEMPAGDLTLLAISNKAAETVDYTVKFYYQVDGTYRDAPDNDFPDDVKSRQAETDTNVSVEPDDIKASTERPGYIVDESKKENWNGIVKADGSLVLKVYFKQQFTVTYKSGDHGTFKYNEDGKEDQTEEQYESLDYNYPTPRLVGTPTAKEGYAFVNWSKKVGDSITENAQIADYVTENVEYIANWNANQYTITYNLNGGDLGVDGNGTAITNPTTYTVETEDFTLNNPTRAGYIFKGWTGTGIDNEENPEETIPATTVTIEKGSTGDRNYIANWEAIEYTITYNLDGGNLLEGASNPDKYTVETETFTLNNPIKSGYKFKGWTGTGIDNEENPEETIPATTVTIEKGSTGNRAYTAKWEVNTETKYHVQYYLEKLESTDKNDAKNYVLHEEIEDSGATNAVATAEIKEYIGFKYDEENTNNVISGTITGDEKLVLKVYYTRNSYKLKLEKDDNIESVEGNSVEKNVGTSIDKETGEATFKYEQPIEIKAILKTIEGHTVTFKEWVSSSEKVLNTPEQKVKQEVKFTMPAEDVTAKATSNILGEYNVELYYEGDDGYPSEPTYKSETPKTANVGDTVTIEDEEINPGYELDENQENILTQTIPATGTVTLRAYFKKKVYTLNIVAGDGITEIKLGEQTAGANGTLTGTYKFGESITIDASYGEESGYDIGFGKWESNNKQLMEDNTTQNLTFTMPAGDLRLTAVANKVPKDTKYKVKFYYQGEDGQYPDEPGDDNIVIRDGKTGAQASITPADKEHIKDGYTFDEDEERNILSTGEEGLAADGSTTLKVYFKKQFTVTYKPGNNGTFEKMVIKNLDYGADVPEYTGSKDGNSGYIFDTWKLTKINEVDVTDETEVSKVTANLEYTAQWKAMPIPTVKHRPTEWTNQNVIVTITAPEEGYSIEYRVDDNTNWNDYTEEFEVEQNCVIHARLAKGTNKGEEVDHEIDNIDKIAPEFAQINVNTEKTDEGIITVKATDNLSGIVEYGIKKEEYAKPIVYTCENTIDTELTFNEIYENGTYEIYLKDAAGNISKDTVEITNIVEIITVARIVSAPAEYKYLIGTEYETLELALETSDEAAQVGNVKIEIIRDIPSEKNTIKNGRDYTINLNNHEVAYNGTVPEPTLTVDGKLRVVNENESIQEGKTGQVVSTTGPGIYIKKDGELTLGVDESDGIPSIISPRVEGAAYGIQKEWDKSSDKVYDEKTGKYYHPEGVFNFYDGKVVGEEAFSVQRVNDTPKLYDPSVADNLDTGKREAVLAVVSNIEAVIGKKRYMYLEEAIADANNVIGDSDTQVEITIVKDLVKNVDHKVVVDNTKNIKLDLNGHVFTTTANDYVIENYGKLEIYDSNADGIVKVEAEEANIVRGSIINSEGKTVVDYGYDLNFNFSVDKDDTYKMSAVGKYMSRNAIVYLDGTEIFNFANSGKGDGWSTVDIELGDLSEGEHTIRCYTTSGYAPIYDYFEIKDSTSIGIGKITSSTNTAIFNGISSEPTQEIAYEDIDLSKVVAKGDYYFETRAEGGLISNNTDVHNSTAHSLLELDLTGKEGVYEVVTNATISSEGSSNYYYDIGYITVRTDNKIVGYNDTNGRKVYVSGKIEDQDYKFNLVGGRKYYIQFGYRKDSSNNSGSDCFIIKNMKIGRVVHAGELTITSGIYECTKKGTDTYAGYTAAIQNESALYVNGGEIKATQTYSAGIYNGRANNTAYTEINGGNINTYYHSVLNRVLAKINDGTLYSSNYACVWSEGQLEVLGEEVSISGSEGITTTNSGDTKINAGTIYGSNHGIYNYDDNSTTTINGGNVSATSYAVYNRANGNIKIEDVTITSASTGIYNSSNGTIEINNVEMASVDSSGKPRVQTGLYNDGNGKLILNDGNIYSVGSAGINYNSGLLEINGGTLRTYGDSTAITNSGHYESSNGTVKITGGTIIGPAKGNVIHNSNKGNVIITGGTIESASTEYPAIWNNDIGSTVTIGSKDGNVSTESPVIKTVGANAVNNKLGTFNFYDGLLVGNENYVITGMLTDLPEEYEIVKEIKEDGLQYVTLGIPTSYVAKISASENPDVSKLKKSYYKLEDGYYYFITLNSAVQACSKTNTYTIELIDDPWVYRTITVDENQDITVKFNDKTMYFKTPLNIENNGKIKFVNENIEDVSEEARVYGNIIANGGLLIKNNENAEMNLESISISYTSSQGSSSAYRKLIDNYGDINIKDSKYYVYYNSSSYPMYVYDIYNEQTGTLNIDNINISGNGHYPIRNYGKDKVDGENTTYSAVIKNSTISYKYYTYGVCNDGEGTMLIEKSTISSYNESRNNSSGSIILRNSTISSSQYELKNNSTGYIEIDNSTIKCYTRNSSSGRILVKGADSKLNGIGNGNANGTVEMLAGKVSRSGSGIDNSGILIISGGEVIGSNYSDTSGIYNRSSGKATISGEETKITGSGYGIHNEGTVTVESGIIRGNGNSGIYNSKELTLGIKDGTVKYNPTVYGKTNGVYNTGTFNFYDGIIDGKEAASITGIIPTETEEEKIRTIHGGEDIFDDGTVDRYSIAADREISVLEKVYVASVKSNGKKYTSINEAYANTEATDTIEIIHDVSINGTVKSVEIEEGKNITLDLNGCNIEAGNEKTIINNGTFKIIDSKSHTDEGGNIIEGKFVNGANTILENNGTATIENGSYELTLSGSSSNYYNMFVNSGTLVINSQGTFNAKGQYSRILNNTTGEATINNGTLTSTASYSTTINNGTGTVNINGGTIKGSSYSVYNNENGEIVITDGTFSGNMYNNNAGIINISGGTLGGQVYNRADGNINISGGTINNQVYNYGAGEINISGGTITCGSTSAVYNNNSGTVNITGGTFSGSGYGVYNSSTGTINIDGTKLSEENQIMINGRNNNNAHGIYNYSSGTINIKGFVNIRATSGNTSYTEYGIYNNGTGIINIGDPEKITNNVKISSTDYGIYNYINSKDQINYYGGTITAPTAVSGYITSIPDKYQVVRSRDEANNEVYEIGKTEEVAQVGGNKFGTLAQAIEATETGTIKILKDIVITESDIMTINDNQDLTIDLYGNTIKLHTYSEAITNNGSLKVIDSTEDKLGKIYGFAGITIKNYGEFELASGNIIIDQLPNAKVIHNMDGASIKISGGLLRHNAKSINSVYYNIYNESTDNLEITGGTIYSKPVNGIYRWDRESTMYEVYCTQRAHIIMSGGTIYDMSGSDNTTYGIYMVVGGNVDLSGDASIDIDYGIKMDAGGTINISENAKFVYDGYSIYAKYSNKDNLEINIDGGTTRKIDGNALTSVTLTGGNVIGQVSGCGTVDVYEGVNFNVSVDAICSCTNVNIHEGATVTSTSNAISGCTNVNIDNGTIVGNVYSPTVLNMTGGSITGKGYGIQLNNKSAVATITGGTVTATAGPGILISSGTLILGKDDGERPSQEIPAITGSTYGVKNDGGTFNFYDGILTGSTHATSGTVTNTPEMFNVIYRANGTIGVLGIEATVEQVAEVNNVYYSNLESAVAAAVDNNGLVELCKDITTETKITIPVNSSITIDLRGYSINGYTESGALFTNNGTLVIEDSTNEGTNLSTIRNYTGTVIVNNGTLTIGTNDNNVYTNAPKIIGKTIAIENNGDFYFVDGQFGISEEEGDIIVDAGNRYKPNGYKVERIEGTNIYTLVQE